MKGQRQKWNHERNQKDLFEDTCKCTYFNLQASCAAGFWNMGGQGVWHPVGRGQSLPAQVYGHAAGLQGTVPPWVFCCVRVFRIQSWCLSWQIPSRAVEQSKWANPGHRLCWLKQMETLQVFNSTKLDLWSWLSQLATVHQAMQTRERRQLKRRPCVDHFQASPLLKISLTSLSLYCAMEDSDPVFAHDLCI